MEGKCCDKPGCTVDSTEKVVASLDRYEQSGAKIPDRRFIHMHYFRDGQRLRRLGCSWQEKG